MGQGCPFRQGDVCGKDSVPPVHGGNRQIGCGWLLVPTLFLVSKYCLYEQTTLTRMMVQETPLALDVA